jgi:DNA invertase Pin-like site-specific DNA recombinase
VAKHPGLMRRGTRWYLRAKVPVDLVEIIGRSEVWRSLQTGEHALAVKRFRRARADLATWFLDALRVLGEIKHRGVHLHLIDLGGDVTGNGVARLVFTILSAVAEAERDRIRERISDVKRDQRARGRYLGGTVPFGFSVGEDGELVEVPEQQEAITTMRELRRQGLSLRAIAAAVETRHAIKISHAGVNKVLRATGCTGEVE